MWWSTDAIIEKVAPGKNVFEHGQRLLEQLDNTWQIDAIIGLWVSMGICLVVDRSRNYSKNYVNPNARRIFMEIVNSYSGGKIQDTKGAKLVAELVLKCMTDAEKETIKTAYKNTKWYDDLSVGLFVAQVNMIADRVFTENPNIMDKFNKIANGDYGFKGWVRGLGHSGR